MSAPKFDIEHFDLGGGTETLIVNAGRKTTTHVVPPAGEDYAFDRDDWTRRVELSVSPTGRSVRVWVDGVEWKASR